MICQKYMIRISTFMCLALSLSCNGNSKQPHTQSESKESAIQSHASASPAVAPTSVEPTKIIPDFTFYILQSGIRFSREDLAKDGKNIVFILFDPSCSHCQHEARDLGQHYSRVKDVHVYFVSMNDPALMSTFLDTYAKPLIGKDNITLLYDRNAEFINKFHIPSQYPATYVYGSDGILKQHWSGEKDIEEVIAAINQV
ncbi:peroxiredoxin family protein [Parapedobacter tibetensis]|uniref:peroxiredoxin family protein n=1 Tax=Parapedobacter tibetensis TaxID=2972951 RepID=UPI00214D237D|nr:peroxiredoxin family protein [Parapedobacter tibetensis]